MVLFFGLPLGWLLIHWSQGYAVQQQLTQHSGLYLCLCIGALLAFGSFGWFVGYNEERSKAQSLTDSLTHCFNFRYFHERFAQELQRTRRDSQVLSVMILDIDKFKSVNGKL